MLQRRRYRDRAGHLEHSHRVVPAYGVTQWSPPRLTGSGMRRLGASPPQGGSEGHKTFIFRGTAAGTRSYLRSAFRVRRGAKIFLNP